MNNILKVLVCLILAISIQSCKEVNHSQPAPVAKKNFASNGEAVNVTGTAYVLLDYTEGQNYNVDMSRMLGTLMSPNINKISITPIRDLSFGKHHDIYLSVKKGHSGNRLIEENRAKKAMNDASIEFDDIMFTLNQQYSGKEMSHSAIVNSVCDIVSNAKSSDYVVIFSDLIENNQEGVNFRSFNESKITDYLKENCQADSTRVLAVVEAFRPKDNIYMRKCIRSWQKYFEGQGTIFSFTTNI